MAEMTRERPHPGPATYVAIAVVLAVITLIEVVIYYLPAMAPVVVPVLLGLSAAKFALVVMFYMHLKFDSPLFSAFFVAGLTVAGTLVVAFILLLLGQHA